MARMTLAQIGELITIDKASETGIRAEVQELIVRLTSGGVSSKLDDPRHIQAKVLWNKGWGRMLGFENVWVYLATLPDVPARPPVEYLNRLILVDRRVKLTDACRLAGLEYSGNDQTYVSFDPAKAKADDTVYWMWFQDGRRNRGKDATTCRQEFVAGEVGLDAFEFAAAYVQDSAIVGTREVPHCLDLLGSVCADDHDVFACGGLWGGRARA